VDGLATALGSLRTTPHIADRRAQPVVQAWRTLPARHTAPSGATGKASEREDGAGFPPSRGGGPAKQLGDPIETRGLIANDPLQHRGRGPLPILQDGLPAGDLPPGLDSRHHNLMRTW
jgi:hypothetical protein